MSLLASCAIAFRLTLAIKQSLLEPGCTRSSLNTSGLVHGIVRDVIGLASFCNKGDVTFMFGTA